MIRNVIHFVDCMIFLPGQDRERGIFGLRVSMEHKCRLRNDEMILRSEGISPEVLTGPVKKLILAVCLLCHYRPGLQISVWPL